MESSLDSYPESEKPMLKSAYNVISRMELWKFLMEYNPPIDKGFMWDDNETVIQIMSNMNDDYKFHSGSSLAYVMRIMQNIAKTIRE